MKIMNTECKNLNAWESKNLQYKIYKKYLETAISTRLFLLLSKDIKWNFTNTTLNYHDASSKDVNLWWKDHRLKMHFRYIEELWTQDSVQNPRYKHHRDLYITYNNLWTWGKNKVFFHLNPGKRLPSMYKSRTSPFQFC